jgi:hypothetical protein
MVSLQCAKSRGKFRRNEVTKRNMFPRFCLMVKTVGAIRSATRRYKSNDALRLCPVTTVGKIEACLK